MGFAELQPFAGGIERFEYLKCEAVWNVLCTHCYLPWGIVCYPSEIARLKQVRIKPCGDITCLQSRVKTWATQPNNIHCWNGDYDIMGSQTVEPRHRQCTALSQLREEIAKPTANLLVKVFQPPFSHGSTASLWKTLNCASLR